MTTDKETRPVTDTTTNTNLPYALNEHGVPTPEDAQAALENANPPFLALAEPYAAVKDGWKITILRTCDATHAETITLPDWADFRPASAGHRLIEYGYMLPAAAHFAPDREAGWHPVPGKGWSAPAYPRDELAG